MSARIVQFTSFPIGEPRHGGQLRAWHTRHVLELAGHNVKTISVFNQQDFPTDRADVSLAGVGAYSPYTKYWQVGDFTGGQAAALDPKIYGKLVELVSSDHFDLVVLEEPWLGSAVIRLQSDGYLPMAMIYNAYNIEHKAKMQILQDACYPEAAEISDAVMRLEQEIARRARCCTATTEADAAEISNFTKCPVLIARNGTIKRKLDHLSGILPAGFHPDLKYLLFVGSVHPPNVNGFCELVLPVLGILRADEKVAVAGKVCDPIYQRIQHVEIPYICRDKLSLIGQVSDYALSCLIANATGIILPIPFGGGSNLKTAEALISGKRIVATNYAFRGFEEFMTVPGIIIADDAQDFGAGMRATFDTKHSGELVRDRVDVLLWERSLQSIVEAVEFGLAGHKAPRAKNLA